MLNIGLTSQEFWAWVVALDVLALVYVGRGVILELGADPEVARGPDGKVRVPEPPVTWGQHWFCGAIVGFFVVIALEALM